MIAIAEATMVPRRRPACMAPRPLTYRSQADDGQVRRIRHLWEETDQSQHEIARSVDLPRKVVAKVIEDHPTWRPRARLADVDGGTRLLNLLIGYAERNEVCPGDMELGNLLGVTKMYCQYMMKKLVERRHIKTRRVRFTKGSAASMHRVVFITATGLRTKDPTIKDAWFSAGHRNGEGDDPAAALLERAKNFIRSKGPMVCNADVLYPGREGIIVGRDHYLIEEFFTYAYRRGFA